MSLLMLARYPFLPEARNILSGISLDELFTSEIYKDARVLGFLRVRSSITGEPVIMPSIAKESGQKEIFLSFLVAKLILIALDDPLITRRFANVERDKLVKSLTEVPDDIDLIASTFEIRFRKDDNGYVIHFIDFIRYAKNFSDERFRLIKQKVNRGWLPINSHDFVLLIREAFVERFVKEVESQKEYGKYIEKYVKDELRELENLKDEYVSNYTSVDLGKVDVDAFPPCMKTIINKIKQGINVSHEARFSMVAFLHKIGMSNDDILSIFATVPDFRKDITEYQIKHITGEISGKEYSVPKCATMQANGLCVKNVVRDKLCEKKWMTHPLLYYKIKKESKSKKVPSKQNKNAEEQ